MKKLSILIIVLAACNTITEEKIYFPDGSLQYEVNLYKGLKDGISRTFNDSSKIIRKGYWHQDTLLSYVEYFYHLNGLLKQVDSISKLDSGGYLTQYYTSGNKKRQGPINIKGKVIGTHKFYYDDEESTLMEVDYYDESGKAYDYEKYNKDGSLREDSRVALIRKVSDTVSIADKIRFRVYMTNNRSKTRVVVGRIFDNQRRTIMDTIGIFYPPMGKDDGVDVILEPSKTGKLNLYGLIQDGEVLENGKVDIGLIKFIEEFYIIE